MKLKMNIKLLISYDLLDYDIDGLNKVNDLNLQKRLEHFEL